MLASVAKLGVAPRPSTGRLRSRSRVGASVVASAASEEVKFTPAVVRENRAADGEGNYRLLVLSIEDKWKRVETLKAGDRPGQESPRWLDGFTTPGQVIALTTAPDAAKDASLSKRQKLRKMLLLPIASTPYEVRRDSAFIDSSIVEVLVDAKAGLALKAPDGKTANLAELPAGFELFVSEPEGRGFTSVLDAGVGLQSALEGQRNLLLIGSGQAGIAALRCCIEWQPVAAHAGVHSVTAFLEAPSAAGAPFIQDFDRWRESGIRLFPLYGAGGAGKLVAELAAGRIADFVGGSPRKGAVLMGGVEGDARVKLSKALQDSGFEPEQIFFIDLL